MNYKRFLTTAITAFSISVFGGMVNDASASTLNTVDFVQHVHQLQKDRSQLNVSNQDYLKVFEGTKLSNPTEQEKIEKIKIGYDDALVKLEKSYFDTHDELKKLNYFNQNLPINTYLDYFSNNGTPMKNNIGGMALEDSQQVEISLNIMGSNFSIDGKDFKTNIISKSADAMQFVFCHEISHLIHKQMDLTFNHPEFTSEQNSKISKEIHSSKNKSLFLPLSSNDNHNTYFSFLQENMADSLGAIMFLKLNNFSQESIDFVKDMKEQRINNLKESIKEDKTNVVIQDYQTHDSLQQVLDNLSKIKNMSTEEQKAFAVNLASKNLVTYIKDNPDKGFLAEEKNSLNQASVQLNENVRISIEEAISKNEVNPKFSANSLLEKMLKTRQNIAPKKQNTNALTS